MKDVRSGMGVTNVSDLVWKEIYGICETKNLPKNQVNIYKMTKRETYKKFTNSSDEELNTKNNKKPMSEMMSRLLLLNDIEEEKQEV